MSLLPHLQTPTTHNGLRVRYYASEIDRIHRVVDTQLFGVLQILAVNDPGVIKIPDDDALLVSAGTGLSVNIKAGAALVHKDGKDIIFAHQKTDTGKASLPNNRGGGNPIYLFVALELQASAESPATYIEGNDTRETGVPVFEISDYDTMDGGLLIAEIHTGASSVSEVIDRREFIQAGGALPDGGTEGQVLVKNSSTDGDASWQNPELNTPTGTGFIAVIDGVQDAAAKLVSNADVASDAAIAESKLSLASDAAAGTPSRRTLGTGPQQAAAGNHGHSNATTSIAGFMSGTDKTRLDNATASPTASTLVIRDSNGRAQIAAPASDSDIATKKYVDDTANSGAPDADESTKGITKLSVAPVSDPVAVGDNDPRVAPFVASGASHTSGLVPDPGATPGSAKFLREDATWATPPGGSLSVEQDGEPPVNDVDGIVLIGASVTDNEDGSVLVEITPASVGAAEAVHTHDLADVTDVTATASELNVLDGITASTTELNYVDGVTSAIQTQLDGKAPTAAALPAGGTTGQVLAKTSGTNYATAWVDQTGGGGGIEPEAVAQEGHGLSVGDFIRVTGNDTYAKAQGDSAANAEIAGRVSTVTDTDNFEYLPVGPIVTGSGWTAGEVEFLDPDTPGATTDTPPDTEGEIIKPVLLPINATEAILLPYIGYVVPGEDEGGGGDADTLEGEDGDHYLDRANHTGEQAISTVTGLQTALDDLKKETIVVAVSDETTNITTGNGKVTFRMPFAMTLTNVRASLTTASSSGNPTFDINENGSTILSTKLSIDSGEKTSTTAATAAVVSDANLADDAEITIDIDTAGTGAKGAKITLIGVRA